MAPIRYYDGKSGRHALRCGGHHRFIGERAQERDEIGHVPVTQHRFEQGNVPVNLQILPWRRGMTPPIVVEAHRLLQRGELARVHIGRGQPDITQRGCLERAFPSRQGRKLRRRGQNPGRTASALPSRRVLRREQRRRMTLRATH